MTTSVEIFADAEARIRSLARESADGLETGGILLGHGPDKEGLIEVTVAGDAGPKAKRTPGFFLRDLDHARDLAARAWEDSHAIWVGEWHTHPYAGRRPSSVDLMTYATLLASSELSFEAFVSVIVTADPDLAWGEPRLDTWVLAMADLPDPSRPGTKEDVKK